ncbi:MAG: hypothetical protein Kow0081_1950 [Candidatus Dojkabacteria bacterium]
MLSSLNLQIDLANSNWQESLGYAILFFVFLILVRLFFDGLIAILRRYLYKTFTFYIFQELGKIPWYTIVFVSIYIFLLSLDAELPGWLSRISQGILLLAISFYLVAAVNSAIRKWGHHKTKLLIDQTRISTISYITIVARVSIWVFSITFVMQSIGIDVSALITGIGLSGLAIAFALRSAIKDMIASIIILLEQPVRIGDRISVDRQNGYVKKVGIKSTILIDEDGRELVLPNSLITEKAIKNYKGDETRDGKITIEILRGRKRKSPTDLIRKLIATEFQNVVMPDSKLFVKEENDEGRVFSFEFQLKNNENKDVIIESLISKLKEILKAEGYKVKKIVLESIE